MGKSGIWGIIPPKNGKGKERGYGRPLAWCGLLPPLGLSTAVRCGLVRGGHLEAQSSDRCCRLPLFSMEAATSPSPVPPPPRGEGTFQLPAFPVQRTLPGAYPDPSETLTSLRLHPRLCVLSAADSSLGLALGAEGSSLPCLAMTSPGTAIWQHQLAQG